MSALRTADLWIASGQQLCDRDETGRLFGTPDLWRAFLARPELVPPAEACDAERALHAGLLDQPLRAVPSDAVAALRDDDARENWTLFLRFRDRVAAAPTLEAAWLGLHRAGVGDVPPLLLGMLTQLVVHASLGDAADPFAVRAAECLFRTQRAAIHQGALLLADEEVLDARHTDFGPLGALLENVGAAPGGVELDVLSAANAPDYAARSDAHDFALDIAEGRPGQHGLARALERFVGHVLGLDVAIQPAATIEDPAWRWHVGLDATATGIVNALWAGETVAQARLAQIVWLARLTIADQERVVDRARGHPVYLALAMDAAGRVRLKPQNLALNLPLREDA